MNLRKGFLFATGLAFAATGCASGGGGGSAAPAMSSSPAAAAPVSNPADGERPREDEFTRAAQDFLDDGFAQEMLGQAATAQAALQNAVTQAELAVQADPTNPRAHMLLGEAYLALGRYVEAGNSYEQALELRPAYAAETDAEREQGWVTVYEAAAPLVQAGDYDRSIELFRAADQIYANRPEVKIILGQILVQEGQYDEGIRYLEEADELIDGPRINEVDSATAEGWRERQVVIMPTIASALLTSEQYDRAIPVLESLREREPENIDYVLSLATSFRETGQDDAAKELYTEVASMNGLPSRNYESLGIGLYQFEDYLAAADAFEKATEASVNSRDALELAVNSLQLYYVSGERETPAADLDRWVAMAQRWRELDPANSQAFIATAQAMNRRQDMSEAGALMNAAEALPFTVRNLQMTRFGGGATVSGNVMRGASEASVAQMRFTFYDSMGNAIGTHDLTVNLPTAEGASSRIDFEFESAGAEVDGYGYEVIS